MAAEQRRDPWSSSKSDPWQSSKSAGPWGGGDNDSWKRSGSSRASGDGGSRGPWLWVGGAAVALLLIGIFIIAPAYKGYAIYSALDGEIPENYVTDMKSLTADKTAAEAAAEAAQAQAREKEREAAVAQESLNACKSEYDDVNAQLVKARKMKDDVMQSLSNDVAQGKTDLEACQQELRDAEQNEAVIKQNEAVIADAARRICCIQRVENPSINSFNIADGRIVCAADGTTAISC